MDEILSVRVDESVLSHRGNLAKQLHQSKKSILKNAILFYVSQVKKENHQNVFDCAFVAWKRDEEISATVKKSQDSFNKSIVRHHPW